MRDQSTAHGIRVGVASRRAAEWLEVAAALAPLGFDDQRDAVCIHRAGRVLYLCPMAPGLLGLEGPGEAVGQPVVDLFDARDRSRVASVLEGAGTHGGSRRAVARAASRLGGGRLELTARRAADAMPPVDVLFLCAADASDAVPEEGEDKMRSPDTEQRRPEAHRATVLICDDEARLGALTAGLLAEYGFHPVTVGTGEDALEALAQGEPVVDVVLLDVNLAQGASARDVLVKMRERAFPARVILTSGLAEEDVEADLITHSSVVGYVAKPYAVEQLVQTIKKALAGRR